MTDNEIIKALECCSQRSGHTCSKCPYHDCNDECVEKRNADIVDLINELQQENEVLNSMLWLFEEKYNTDTEWLKSETKRLGTLLRSYTLKYGPDTAISERIAEIKEEAINEFVDELKKACRDQCTVLSEDLFEVVVYIAERVLKNIIGAQE